MSFPQRTPPGGYESQRPAYHQPPPSGLGQGTTTSYGQQPVAGPAPPASAYGTAAGYTPTPASQQYGGGSTGVGAGAAGGIVMTKMAPVQKQRLMRIFDTFDESLDRIEHLTVRQPYRMRADSAFPAPPAHLESEVLHSGNNILAMYVSLSEIDAGTRQKLAEKVAAKLQSLQGAESQRAATRMLHVLQTGQRPPPMVDPSALRTTVTAGDFGQILGQAQVALAVQER
jgi:hypothetical protein